MSQSSIATRPADSPSDCASPGGKRKADELPDAQSNDSRLVPSRTVSAASNQPTAQDGCNMASFRITPPPGAAPTAAMMPNFKRLQQSTLPFSSSPETKPIRAPPTPEAPFDYEVSSETQPDLTEAQMEVRVRVRRRLLEFGNVSTMLPAETDRHVPSLPLRLLFVGKMSYADFSSLRRLLREQWNKLALQIDDVATCLGVQPDLIELWRKHPTSFANAQLDRQATSSSMRHDDSPDEEVVRVSLPLLPPPPLVLPKLKWKGLDNYGNTCYVNVIVQALFFCPGFLDALSRFVADTNSLLAREAKQNIRRLQTPGRVLMFALHDLLRDMNPDLEPSITTTLGNFLREMRLCDKRFQGARQQDAQEFLNFILLTLHATVLDLRKLPPPPMVRMAAPLVPLADSDEATASDDELAPQGKRPKVESPPPPPALEAETAPGAQVAPATTSFVSDMFEGKLEMRIKCLECECSSAKPEPFMDLSLSLLGNREARSLEAILKDFFHAERLSGRDKFSCDHCHAKTEARKGYVFSSLPPILTLHLKRFSYESQRKICSHLMPPLETTFEAYCQTKDENAHAKYRLYAIVFHAGYFANSGHYRCIIRQGRKWILFDDEDVSELTEKEFLTLFPADVESSNTAYILFYHRVRPEDVQSGEEVDSPTTDRIAAEVMAEILPVSAAELPTQTDLMQASDTGPSLPATLSASDGIVTSSALAMLSNAVLMESATPVALPTAATSNVMAAPADAQAMDVDSAPALHLSHPSTIPPSSDSSQAHPPVNMET